MEILTATLAYKEFKYMTPEQIAEKENADATAAAEKAKADDEAKAKADADANHSQNPVKAELDRVRGERKVYTEAEKAAFTLKKNAERAKELGIDPLEVLGGKPSEDDDDAEDDKPVTVGMLKKKELNDATKTAIQIASEQITDEFERELTEHHITHTIKPSGNAQTDFNNARALVNSVKNKQIAEEIARKTNAKTHNSGAGAPAKNEKIFEPTAEEQSYMKPPFNLTKEDIIKNRPK